MIRVRSYQFVEMRRSLVCHLRFPLLRVTVWVRCCWCHMTTQSGGYSGPRSLCTPGRSGVSQTVIGAVGSGDSTQDCGLRPSSYFNLTSRHFQQRRCVLACVPRWPAPSMRTAPLTWRTSRFGLRSCAAACENVSMCFGEATSNIYDYATRWPALALDSIARQFSRDGRSAKLPIRPMRRTLASRDRQGHRTTGWRRPSEFDVSRPAGEVQTTAPTQRDAGPRGAGSRDVRARTLDTGCQCALRRDVRREPPE
jgi:hypothetical protein